LFFYAGVGLVKRTLGNSATPVVELTKTDDGKMALSSNSTMKNSLIVFSLDEEFDEETLDGRKVKSIISQDGNKLVHVQKSDKHSETTIVREFKPDELKMVQNKWQNPYHLPNHTHACILNIAYLPLYIQSVTERPDK